MASVDAVARVKGVPLIHREQHTPPTLSLPIPRQRKRSRKPRESRRSKRERLARLEHEPVPRLFQRVPPKSTASLYRPKGYTGCLEGFFRSAKERRATIVRNNRMLGRRFTHYANINLFAPRHPALINRDFGAFVKELSKHRVRGHWTIEIDRDNIVHWHLLFQDFHGTESALKRLVSRCLLKVETFPRHRVHADRVRNEKQKIDYVLKVRKAGYGKAFNPLDHEARPQGSTGTSDIYARDRVLFRPNTGLAKHGTFGDFWAKGWNEKKLWALIREETATVARNYANPTIRRVVDDMHQRLGLPLARVKWAYCLHPPRHLLEDRQVPPSPSRRRGKAPRSSGLVGSVFLTRRLPAPVRSKPVHGMPGPFRTSWDGDAASLPVCGLRSRVSARAPVAGVPRQSSSDRRNFSTWLTDGVSSWLGLGRSRPLLSLGVHWCRTIGRLLSAHPPWLSVPQGRGSGP